MHVVAICVSSARQEPKKEVSSARFVEGGIEGDSHKSYTEREVSLLRLEDIKAAEKEAGFPFPPGVLAENLVVEGLPEELAPGTRLAVGTKAVLEVIEKGKKLGEPHSYDYRGWCLLPEVGYFLKVVEEGEGAPGDEIKLI